MLKRLIKITKGFFMGNKPNNISQGFDLTSDNSNSQNFINNHNKQGQSAPIDCNNKGFRQNGDRILYIENGSESKNLNQNDCGLSEYVFRMDDHAELRPPSNNLSSPKIINLPKTILKNSKQ
jgi:hypothetical protein